MKASEHTSRTGLRRAVFANLSHLLGAALLCFMLAAAVSAQVSAQGASPPNSSGPEGAPVTVEIFNDYQCPVCAPMNEEVKEFEQAYRGGVRVVFRNYPLPMHKYSLAAAV